MSAELVQVGDTITTDTGVSTHDYLITRVTKTLALSKRKSDGYEYKFKRVISGNMSHPYYMWSRTRYKVKSKVTT